MNDKTYEFSVPAWAIYVGTALLVLGACVELWLAYA